MGRLFWKFFFCIWLAQITAMFGIGATLWIRDLERRQQEVLLDYSPMASFLTESAAQTLHYGGKEALIKLLDKNRGIPVYVIDVNGQDLLGRPVPSMLLDLANSKSPQASEQAAILKVTSQEGQPFSLFSAHNAHREHAPPPPGGQPMLPWIPFCTALVVSFVFAFILAWYFVKPIRTLQSAFAALAMGQMDTRIANQMRKRRDELADLGRDFDHMAGQLQVLLENQRRLLHDVSHEMRSPLARLQAAIGLIRQQPEKSSDILARIERESERMDSLVGELLTLARLESQGIASAPEALDLVNLLDDLLEDARFEAMRTGHQIHFSGHGPAPIQGQAELLHRAIENVVRNALYHSPTQGNVFIELQQKNDHYLLSIEDQGKGVPENELQDIFTPFHRCGKTAHPDGHGLGLAIARQVIENHHGSICAVNGTPGGLRVLIELPILH